MLGISGAFASGGEALIPKIVPATLEASYYISVNFVRTLGYDSPDVYVTTNGINIVVNGSITRLQWREDDGIWRNHTDPNYGSSVYNPYTYVGVKVFYEVTISGISYTGSKEYDIVR